MAIQSLLVLGRSWHRFEKAMWLNESLTGQQLEDSTSGRYETEGHGGEEGDQDYGPGMRQPSRPGKGEAMSLLTLDAYPVTVEWVCAKRRRESAKMDVLDFQVRTHFPPQGSSTGLFPLVTLLCAICEGDIKGMFDTASDTCSQKRALWEVVIGWCLVTILIHIGVTMVTCISWGVVVEAPAYNLWCNFFSFLLTLRMQYAEAITASPDFSRQGMELETLLGTLLDPFSTRKQIPRTPESLSEYSLIMPFLRGVKRRFYWRASFYSTSMGFSIVISIKLIGSKKPSGWLHLYSKLYASDHLFAICLAILAAFNEGRSSVLIRQWPGWDSKLESGPLLLLNTCSNWPYCTWRLFSKIMMCSLQM